MQIYVINLAEKTGRWQRMAGLLHGLPFHRIAAVDGKTVAGPEHNIRTFPKQLSRYNRAANLSHRAAWEKFLAGPDRYACVLEDDVFLSPDFPKFINNEDWIPPGCDLVKIETTQAFIWFTGGRIACLDRQTTQLRSLHLGAAAYIITRRGAEILLEMSKDVINRPLDRILFDKMGRKRLQPVYQLVPALCIQGSHRSDGVTFPDMESSIDRQVPPTVRPIIIPSRKTLLTKIGRELVRPFHQFRKARRNAWLRSKGLHRQGVPFA
jgi:glycosyl transferase family 25